MNGNIPYTIRLKTCLRMCVQRLRYAQEKQQALAKQDRRHVATLLSQNKEQMAYFRVESLITNDIHVELLELLELYCELLLARINIVNSIENELDMVSNHIDDGINEAIRSLAYASSLYVPEVKELGQLRDLVMLKFGKDFIKGLQDNKIGVPEKIVKKCLPDLPPEGLVVMYLQEIAKTYEVPYSKLELSDSELEDENTDNEQTGEDDDDDDDDKSGNITDSDTEKSLSSEGKPIVAIDNDAPFESANGKHPITVRKARMTSDQPKKDLNISKDIKNEVKFVHPKPTTTTKKSKASDSEIDELKKRFAALRR